MDKGFLWLGGIKFLRDFEVGWEFISLGCGYFLEERVSGNIFLCRRVDGGSR